MLFVAQRQAPQLVDHRGKPLASSGARELYIDDGGANNIRIYSNVSGPPGFGQEIDHLVEEVVLRFHRVRMGGPNFREFHLAGHKERSWPFVRDAYRDLLTALMETARRAGGRILLSIDSKDALRGSPKFLRPDLLSSLEVVAPFATQAELAAVAAETELVWWLARRAKFHARNGERLAVFADEKGTSLSRLKELWTIFDGKRALFVPRSNMLAKLAEVLSLVPGVSVEKGDFPTIVDVRAVDSERFFCIQACDLLSGLALGALRALSGSPRTIDQEKLAMLDTWVDMSKPRAKFPGLMYWDGSEVQPREERKKFHIELEFQILG